MNRSQNRILLVLGVFISTLVSCHIVVAQDDCACCTEYHSEFDFWVGDWQVYDTLGNLVGENTIEKLESNCIVSEHWRGAKGLTGRSYNYFNTSDSTWNQVWIDSGGNHLELKGTAAKGKMVLKSELLKGTRIDFYANRITWSENDDGTVTQLWEILDKNDAVLSVAFKGIYKRK